MVPQENTIRIKLKLELWSLSHCGLETVRQARVPSLVIDLAGYEIWRVLLRRRLDF